MAISVLLVFIALAASLAGATPNSASSSDTFGTSPFAGVPLDLTPRCANSFNYAGIYTIDANGDSLDLQGYADRFYQVVIIPNSIYTEQPNGEAFLNKVWQHRNAGGMGTECMGYLERDFYKALVWRYEQINS